jgi:hypothetical protein
MATDPLIERHGLVRKKSTGLGTVTFLFGIGAMVAGAAVYGLHFASEHGWYQPAPPRQAATEENVVETTAAQLAPTEPTSSLMMTFGENEDAGALAASAAPLPPKPAVKWVPPRPKPKPEPSADPFATQQ